MGVIGHCRTHQRGFGREDIKAFILLSSESGSLGRPPQTRVFGSLSDQSQPQLIIREGVLKDPDHSAHPRRII